MKRLSEEQYIAMTNLNMLTVINDALKHMLSQEENGVIDETELQRIQTQCARWLRSYHEVATGER